MPCGLFGRARKFRFPPLASQTSLAEAVAFHRVPGRGRLRPACPAAGRLPRMFTLADGAGSTYEANSRSLVPGTCVTLDGLKARPDLNGVVGLINGPASFGPLDERDDDEPPRYPVVVMIDGEVQEANLKPQNLRPAGAPPEWYTPPECKCGLVHIGLAGQPPPTECKATGPPVGPPDETSAGDQLEQK